MTFREALESERKLEQEFVAEALRSEKAPKGWPAALIMFHIGMWRERLRDGFAAALEGRDYSAPASIDEINDNELPSGIGTPLTDAAARSDQLLGELIDLYERMGDRPFAWVMTKTTTEAVLRNSLVHPRVHIFQYLDENGRQDDAFRMFDETHNEMEAAQAPLIVRGAAKVNLSGVRARQGRLDDAIELLEQGLAFRPDLKPAVASDPDFEPMRSDPRFQKLISQ